MEWSCAVMCGARGRPELTGVVQDRLRNGVCARHWDSCGGGVCGRECMGVGGMGCVELTSLVQCVGRIAP